MDCVSCDRVIQCGFQGFFFFAFLWALLAIPSWLGGPHAIGVWSFRGDVLTFLGSGAFH